MDTVLAPSAEDSNQTVGDGALGQDSETAIEGAPNPQQPDIPTYRNMAPCATEKLPMLSTTNLNALYQVC